MKNKILIIIITIVSLLVIAAITVILLDTTGVINQGNFRINDVILTSTVEVGEHELEVETPTSLTDFKLMLSQNNKISMLVAKGANAGKMYIDNIKINSHAPTNNIYIYQTGYDEIKYDTIKNEINIYSVEKDEQYLVELNVNNKEFLKDRVIPNDLTSVTFDGTILKLFNIELSDVEFEISFDLNIIDIYGNGSVCHMKFKMPNEELIENGVSITRQDLSEYKFKLKLK